MYKYILPVGALKAFTVLSYKCINISFLLHYDMFSSNLGYIYYSKLATLRGFNAYYYSRGEGNYQFEIVES